MVVKERHEPKGVQAIDSALKNKYKERVPLIFAPMVTLNGGGEDPLEMISVFERDDPTPHWHFVTYGFSDLYEKKVKNTPISGYGFELTFRVKKNKGEEEPPSWVISFLQDLARHVFTTGSRFDNGFYLSTNKKINFSKKTQLNTMMFTYDPELKPINTPNGIVVFLQVVGITEDEKIAMLSWNSSKFLDTLIRKIPLFITDVERKSVLSDTAIKTIIEKGISADGSSTETLLITSLAWREEKKRFGKKMYEIDIPTRNFIELSSLIQWRLGKGRELTLIGPKQRVLLSMRDQSSVYVNDFELKILLDINTIKEVVGRLGTAREQKELTIMKTLKFNLLDL